MTAVTYTAVRELVTGHVADQTYTIALRVNSLERGKKVRRSEQEALSGKSEALLWHNLKTFQATTAALRGGELEAVREFLESVSGGEPFAFDEFGSVGAPHNPINVLLVGNYSERRAVRQGDGGDKDYFRFSFSFRTL